jgi:hypothetical protein
MTVEWSGYAPYVPPHWGPVRDMTRAQARECYEHLMAARAARRRQLEDLLSANDVHLSPSDEGLIALGGWYRAEVEPSPSAPRRLADLWYAVTNDVALFLGDVTIERAPMLHWAFFTWGKRDVAYQRHVVMGFPGDERLRLNWDFDRRVAAYGVCAATGALPTEDDEVLTWVQLAVDKAQHDDDRHT